MSNSTWVELIGFETGVDGAALTNSTTATSLLATPSKFTLPANFFNQVGKKLRVRAAGRISNIVTTPGTLTLDFRLGSVVAFSSGAFSLNAAAKTNVSWELQLELVVRSLGSGTAATLLGIGKFTSESVVGAAAGTTLTAMLPASAPAAGTGFDSTAAQQIDLYGTFSVANAGNSIQVHQFSLESLN